MGKTDGDDLFRLVHSAWCDLTSARARLDLGDTADGDTRQLVIDLAYEALLCMAIVYHGRPRT